MGKKEKALEYFHSGYNCAQSVFLPFAGENESNTLISSGFGGGIARLQKTCGAVTGAVMVLGLRYGSKGCPDEESKKIVYNHIRDFTNEFIETHGSDQCLCLLGTNMNTEEGKQKIKEMDLHKNVCEKCIETAISLLDKE
jgi:C_GCAxxG_C_C family probable redox protein